MKDLSPQQLAELVITFCFNHGLQTSKDIKTHFGVDHVTIELWRKGQTKKPRFDTLFKVRKGLETEPKKKA